jgi:molybdopterin-guanine dinucleotide biosynthesis protein A
VVLAGGRATRFPGKLQAVFDGVPLLEHVVRNVSPAATQVVVAAQPADGPLGGLLAALAEVGERFVFVVAGDAPFVDAPIVRELASLWRAGDEAVVVAGVTGGPHRIEPLVALYDSVALRREGPAALAAGGSMLAAIAKLHARFVLLDVAPHTLCNINTPADLERALALLPPPENDAKGVTERA